MEKVQIINLGTTELVYVRVTRSEAEVQMDHFHKNYEISVLREAARILQREVLRLESHSS